MASSDLRFVRNFKIFAAIIIIAGISAVFFGFHLRTEKLTIGVIHQQARALFNQVIVTRRWVAEHGGVYVRLKPGIDPHPYLTAVPGLPENIEDTEGTPYTLRIPGFVIREISGFAKKSGLYSFHIASLKPINEATNSPDPFETQALKRFEQGEKEVGSIEQTTDGPVYRYMAPLYYEQTCDRCHSHQGYKPGDIRGGISVNIPMTSVYKELRTNRWYTIISGVFVLGVLFGLLSLISRKFTATLNEAQGKLLEMATTDGLTGLLNRRTGLVRVEEEMARHFRSRAPLSCLMLDIDHFKSVNDTHGHLAGDAVMSSFAEILKNSTRAYDVTCRYGGEEFLILLPETGLAGAAAAAENIRERISDNAVVFDDKIISVTASIGVAQAGSQEDETSDALIQRADSALYKAKASGRNRVVAVVDEARP